MKEIQKENILILFGADSNLEWGRSFQLARAFAKLGHNVMYIDLPLPFAQSIIGGQPERKEGESFLIFQPRYGLPYGRLQWLRGINKKVVLKQIRKAIHKEEFRPTVIWVYSPYEPDVVRVLKDELKPRRVIYDCADDRVALAELHGESEAGIKVKNLEQEVVQVCDAVISITENLKETKKGLHTRIIVIPNGIDLDMFSPALNLRKPKEYAGMPGKLILYVGTIEKWFDLELISQSAEKYPEYSFVLIGPERIDTGILKGKGNVYLLGHRNYSDMPAYIYYSDLCIIPFKDTKMTKSCDSLKALQYLSMDKLIVSTHYSGVRDYNGLVTVASDPESFMRQLKTLLESKLMNDNSDTRRKVLEEYSWESLAQKALSAINERMSI